MKSNKLFALFLLGFSMIGSSCTSDVGRYEISQDGSLVIDSKSGDVFRTINGKLIFQIPEDRILAAEPKEVEFTTEIIAEEPSNELLFDNELIGFITKAYKAGKEDDLIIKALIESGLNPEYIPEVKKFLANLRSNDLDYKFRR